MKIVQFEGLNLTDVLIIQKLLTQPVRSKGNKFISFLPTNKIVLEIKMLKTKTTL